MNDLKLDKEINPVADNSVNGIFGQHGWICPKCGRVYSPFTKMCLYCCNESQDCSSINKIPKSNFDTKLLQFR